MSEICANKNVQCVNDMVQCCSNVLNYRVLHSGANGIMKIGSSNALSPVWRQAITWNNGDLLSIVSLRKT